MILVAPRNPFLSRIGSIVRQLDAATKCKIRRWGCRTTKSGGASNSAMDGSVRYHPLFDCDVREAAAWYDRRLAGLGDAFVDLARQCITDVIANPERFAMSSAGCRYVQVPRSLYVVLFDVTDSDVLILGVLHTARSIEKWRN